MGSGIHGGFGKTSGYRKAFPGTSILVKKDDGYTGGKIRLISCGAGAGKFAQNLANKMGVEVIAPTDTVWAWANGELTIGATQFDKTGKWKSFKPYKNRSK